MLANWNLNKNLREGENPYQAVKKKVTYFRRNWAKAPKIQMACEYKNYIFKP